MRKMRIMQKDAYISVDFLDKKTEIIKIKSETDDKKVFSFDVDLPNGTKKTIAVANPKIQDNNAIKQELESFVNSIINDTPVVVNEVDGYLAMDIAHQIVAKIGSTSL
jgi:hypothetical protein